MRGHKEEAERLLAEVQLPDGGYVLNTNNSLLNGEALLAHAILALVETLKDAS